MKDEEIRELANTISKTVAEAVYAGIKSGQENGLRLSNRFTENVNNGKFTATMAKSIADSRHIIPFEKYLKIIDAAANNGNYKIFNVTMSSDTEKALERLGFKILYQHITGKIDPVKIISWE